MDSSSPAAVTVQVTVLNDPLIEISALCNASNTHLLYMKTLLPAKPRVIFTGQGENTVMLWEDNKGEKTETLDLGTYKDDRVLTLGFRFRVPGSETQSVAARVQEPKVTHGTQMTLITVTSEDSTDNDNNDTVVMIACIKPPQYSPRSPAPSVVIDGVDSNPVTAIAATQDTPLSLHAKIAYGPYGNKHVQGLSEVYADVNWKSVVRGQRVTLEGAMLGDAYKALNWTVKRVELEEDNLRTLVTWLYVDIYLENCHIDNMKGATLIMRTAMWYMFGRPTGYKSFAWAFTQHGGDRKVVRIDV